ncbi:hypothetical protein SS37A_35600 (plasmid) [Methylocystis iwaonis]|uniref:Transposase DDE domain-containing protein n=1 Tax=Methylocystis iwaonis TaxID=2885079 RepID=A0ABM8EDE2_9HYPH|nr:hypothetical protein SS37A_35600 [Methylocystis iwaonis]
MLIDGAHETANSLRPPCRYEDASGGISSQRACERFFRAKIRMTLRFRKIAEGELKGAAGLDQDVCFAALDAVATLYDLGERRLAGKKWRKPSRFTCNSEIRHAIPLAFEPLKPLVGGQQMGVRFVQQIEIDTLPTQPP